MSELDEDMLQRMIHIVNDEHKPFSYFDFLDIMKPKTYRNKISQLKKEGIVEPDIRSSIAFHTLKDHKFGKPGTPTHTVVFPNSRSHRHDINISQDDPLYKTLATLPFGSESVHDIRLRFTAPDIYRTFSCLNFPPLNNFPVNSNSADITIPSFYKDGAIVRIVIHRTDVVSVIIGCSKQPIALDVEGLMRFSSLLTRAEDKLQSILDNYYRNQKQHYNDTTCFPNPSPIMVTVPVKIPDYLSWIITMWYFGRDALTLYKGEKFCRTIEDAQHILTQIYSKEYGNGRGKRKHMRIRKEIQQYPNKTVSETIDELEPEETLE